MAMTRRGSITLGISLMLTAIPPAHAFVGAADTVQSCPVANASANPDLEQINRLGIEPRRFANLGEFLAAMPPGAMARLAGLQKAALDQRAKDWPNLCRFQQENAQVLVSGVRPKTVFLGDSITENWKLGDPSLFDASTLNRGIGGQTTAQILLRFYQDVVALRPRVVHIMAGVNDIMGNTGSASDQAIFDNIRAMIDIAKANGIRVVLAAITPSKTFVARPNEDLRSRIAAVNSRLVQLAAQQRVTFIDYTPLLADSEGAFAPALANDGLHPNRDGYALMRPLLNKTLARVAN